MCVCLYVSSWLIETTMIFSFNVTWPRVYNWMVVMDHFYGAARPHRDMHSLAHWTHHSQHREPNSVVAGCSSFQKAALALPSSNTLRDRYMGFWKIMQSHSKRRQQACFLMCVVAVKVVWTPRRNLPQLRQWEWNSASHTCAGRDTCSCTGSSGRCVVPTWWVMIKTSQWRIKMEADSSVNTWESKSFILLFLCCSGLKK